MGDEHASKAQIAIARAVIYRVLSRCFSYPDKELIELFDRPRVDEFFQSWQLLGLSDDAITPITSWLAGFDGHDSALKELEKEFIRLFARPYPDVLVQPYASTYLDSERLIWGRSTAEVARLYEEAGLGMNENFHDVPDHIAAEMEFASYLILEQHKPGRDGVTTSQKLATIEMQFLTAHFFKWVPRFLNLVVENSRAAFYSGIARLASEFTEDEARRISNGSDSLMGWR